ncbi:MAG: hypothetical protein ABGX16_14685 [Pirellulales bacterium]
MTLNVDFDGSGEPEDLREDVNKKLAALDANFLSVISSDSIRDLFAKLELGSVPAVLVFDKTGQLRKRFDNDTLDYGTAGYTYDEHIGPLVTALSAE